MVSQASRVSDQVEIVSADPDHGDSQSAIAGEFQRALANQPSRDHERLWHARSQTDRIASPTADWLATMVPVLGISRETPVAPIVQRLIASPQPVRLISPTEIVSPVAETIPVERWVTIQQSARMLRYLAPSLLRLPAVLALNIVAIYAGESGPGSLKQLAAAAELSERHVRPLLTAARLRSTHLLFSVSRVLRAHGEITIGTRPMAEIAHRYGFGTARTLQSQWTEVMGIAIERSDCQALCEADIERIAGRLHGATMSFSVRERTR